MSKIGLHVVIGPRNGYGDFLRGLVGYVTPDSPLIVKGVGDLGVSREASNILGADRVLPMGRMTGQGWEGLDFHAEGGTRPETIAEAHFREHYEPKIILNRHVKVWEPCNEWSAHWSWQADFYIALMPFFEAYGCGIGLFAASTGNPPDLAYTAIARACRAAKERNSRMAADQAKHILTLHEYGGVGVSIPTLRDTQPFHALRYRRLVEMPEVGLRANDAIIPIVISEAGQESGARFIGVEAFIADYAWYDSELVKDDYLLGATAWTLGNWAEANFQEALPALAEYIRNHPTPPPSPAPPPIPAPEPTRPRGAPRTQYARVYLVIHPAHDTLPAWYAVGGEFQLTTGPSADDGGIGDLDDRAAIVANPQLWGGDQVMREWYEREYPGVAYYGVEAETPADLAAWLSLRGF